MELLYSDSSSFALFCDDLGEVVHSLSELETSPLKKVLYVLVLNSCLTDKASSSLSAAKLLTIILERHPALPQDIVRDGQWKAIEEILVDSSTSSPSEVETYIRLYAQIMPLPREGEAFSMMIEGGLVRDFLVLLLAAQQYIHDLTVSRRAFDFSVY